YYFFIIAAYTEGQVLRDALFLGRFGAERLPYVDFVIAILVGGTLAVYFRIGRMASLTNLTAAALCFFLCNVVVFWWVARVRHGFWLYPIIYVWVGMFGVLAMSQVWTLANYFLTNREAKRLVGFIGSGGIIGGIFGGFLSNIVARSLGAESLLLAMAAAIGISAVLVLLIQAQNRMLVKNSTAPTAVHNRCSATLLESFRLVRSSPHLLTIAAIICVCSVTTYLAGWQFRAIVKESLPDRHAMAAFLGSFYAMTGALAMVVQVALTPRLLRHFGIRVALLVVPVSLFGGTLGLIASGSLWAATLLKGTDKVVRVSINTAAMQLLYLPLSIETKLPAKSFLDTVVVQGGGGLGAVAVLFLTRVTALNPRELGWIVLGLVVLWLAVARKAASQYVATLSETLHQYRLDVERLDMPVLERSATQMLVTGLRSDDAKKIIYTLDLLEGRRWKEVYTTIRGLLAHAAPEVRAKAILVLRHLGDLSVASRIEELIRDPDLNVRTEALLFLSQLKGIDPLSRLQHLGDFQDFSVQAAMVAFLARSGDENNLEGA